MKLLDSQETEIINDIVEPFVQKEWEQNIPCATGLTERGVVITMSNGYRVLVRLYKHSEEIPEATPLAD